MLEFHPLTLEQAELLQEYFKKGKTRLCDQTMGGAMMWRNCFHTQFAYDGECLYFRSEFEPGKTVFTPPVGDLETGVKRLVEHCRQEGCCLSFCSVGEEEKDRILALLPDYFATPTRDWFDYLYSVEKLSTFSGKKLSGQRNHRNFFLKNHASWRFVPLSKENVALAKEFFLQYDQETQKDSPFFQEEERAVLEVLDHLEVYGFFGGMIVTEEKVVALSLGEIIGDTIFVHIEKAKRQVRGSYQMMVSEFLRHFAGGTVFVNREEDVGDPGLRYSKESYHPERLLAKYSIEKREK